jgi:folylpolyglutamate synthase/dihydropteroate synthase
MLPGTRLSDRDAGALAQVARLADRGGARDTWLVLDGAHTRAAATALAATLRAAFPGAALALVVGMAADKDAAGVMAALRAARPMAIAFTQAPIAGSTHRCAQKP